MDKNMQLIWTNRVLRVFSILTGIIGGLMAVVSVIGNVVKTIEGAGLVPNKWLGIAGILVSLGTVAATFSKTPIAAIAAAVPPSKTTAPPSGTTLLLLIALASCSLSACADLTTGPGGAYLPPATSVSYCADAANEAARLNGLALPYPNVAPTVDIQLCAGLDTWTHFYCATCHDDTGALALLEPGDQRCSQDTGRTNAASGAAGFVVCVSACTDPYCQ